jgi:PBSX family phage terminase large subunit
MPDIELLPHQIAFVTSKAPHPAICGGLGSGKSAAATMRIILLMLADKGANTLIGMPTYDLLRLRAIPGVEADLKALGRKYKLNKSEFCIDVLGYGSIYFRSYDNPDRWVAFEVAHAVLDELDTLPIEKAELVWRKASERVRQKRAGINTLGSVTTPDHGTKGFTYKKWGKNPETGYELIKASTIDNIFLPDGYIAQISANYDPDLCDAYLRGEFVNFTSKLVYHFFKRAAHHSDAKIKAGDHLHIGLDFNVGGCCAVVFILSGRGAIAVDEFTSHDTQDFVNNLAKYKGHRITVYPDASGSARSTNAAASDVEIIRNAGYAVDAPASNPFIRDRVNRVNAMLANNELMVNCELCPQLADALESQGYDKKGDPEKYTTHPAIDDWVDAMGYFIHRRFPLRANIGAPKCG